MLVLVILGALAYQTGKLSFLGFLPAAPALLHPAQTSKQTELLIKDLKLKVEIADTNEKRAKGLGGRVSLASDSGMLFIFDKPDFHIFWMKGLSFPLDFIWLKDKKIIDITKNALASDPKTPDSDLPKYQSNQAVDMVLEVNGGFIDKNGLSIGDSIEIP